jgi:hypothetical protein
MQRNEGGGSTRERMLTLQSEETTWNFLNVDEVHGFP